MHMRIEVTKREYSIVAKEAIKMNNVFKHTMIMSHAKNAKVKR